MHPTVWPAYAPSISRRAFMHKPLKGAIALGAAGLLLLGGAGTYALWSDSVTLDGGTIGAGQLDLAVTTAGTWADVSTGTSVPITNIDDFLLVPGDVLTYSLSATLQAEGDNLEATLEADPTSITAEEGLDDDITVTTTVSTGGVAITGPITEDNDGDVIDVVVTLTFDEESGIESQLDTIDLSDLKLTVNQNPR
jgi:alternate signal-mediated exported protein